MLRLTLMNKILRKIRKIFYLNQIRPGPRFGRLLLVFCSDWQYRTASPCDHLCNQINSLLLNFVSKRLFLLLPKIRCLSNRLRFYLDTFRPDFSNFRSEAIITILKAPFPNRFFLNTCLHSRIKLS